MISKPTPSMSLVTPAMTITASSRLALAVSILFVSLSSFSQAATYDFLTVNSTGLLSSQFTSPNGNGVINASHVFSAGGAGPDNNNNPLIFPSQFSTVFPGTGLVQGHLAQTKYGHTSEVTFDLSGYNWSASTAIGIWNITNEVVAPAGGPPVYRLEFLDAANNSLAMSGLFHMGNQDNITPLGHQQLDLNTTTGALSAGAVINVGGIHTDATFWRNFPLGTSKIKVHGNLPTLPLNFAGDGVGYYFAELVPEPSSVVLMCGCALGLLSFRRRSARAALSVIAVAVCVASIGTPAHAYLGSFESGDGYHFGNPVGTTLGGNDVTRYNAGEYGLNNGGPGGSVATIPVDTGLWRVIAGGRLLGQSSDYYVIRHPAPVGHSSPNVLGMTTGNSSYVGIDTEYQYDFDDRDFDGNIPSSLASSMVDMEFYWCPSNAGTGGATSTLSDPGATIQIQDSAGANFFEIGSYGAGEAISYRLLGGTWIDAGFNASGAFDRIDLTFDLLNDTLSFSFFQTIGATNNVVLTTAALGANMDYLGHMGLTMKAENAKNYLDDVDFRINQVAVPEPTGVVLMVSGLVGLLTLRRRHA